MATYKLTKTKLTRYEAFLKEDEKGKGTIEKYMRDVRKFYGYAGKQILTKDLVMAYKEELGEEYAVGSANSMLTAVNGFLSWLGRDDCTVKLYKKQRQLFIPEEKELQLEEYYSLIETALEYGNKRMALIIQTIGSTGIRISELSYITVEAVEMGRAIVDCKGKHRTIFLPRELRSKLRIHIRDNRIKHGPVFVTQNGNTINRSNIWRNMKIIGKRAGVAREKIFPHNLRHLFAREYYKQEKDIAKLADILGHSSIETTRIYIISTGEEHERQIEKLRLLI